MVTARWRPEKLNAILAAGPLAPTAKNLQEQHVYVLQSAEALAKFDAVTPCRYGAPTVLLVAFDKYNVFTYPGGKRNSGIEDATIVATHMILAAADEGVDSCWINNLDPDQLAADLGLLGERRDSDGNGSGGMRQRAPARFPTTAAGNLFLKQ